MTPRTLAVTGATGFIGSRLVELLTAQGMAVKVLSRSASRARVLFPRARFPLLEVVPYEPFELGPWVAALDGVDGVVHLAGAPIAGRWTADFKQAIRTSREVGTSRLVEALGQLRRRPQVLISSSACRYYGISEIATFDESSPPGDERDYLANVCVIWEGEARRAQALDIRTVVLRHGFALAMTPRFRQTLMTFRRFVGGRVGSGRQWISWIHRDDTAGLISHALGDPAMDGVYNAVAPRPVRMADFARHLGAAVGGGQLRLPVPAMIIEQIFGDGATVILDGQRVVSNRLAATRFQFRHPELRQTLADII